VSGMHTLRLPAAVQRAAIIGLVFGGFWLGRYMVADRPLPTVQAAAPAVIDVSGAHWSDQSAPSLLPRS
jgi:hypothetical protein